MPESTLWNRTPSDDALNIWAHLPPHPAFGLLVLPSRYVSLLHPPPVEA